MQNKLRQGKYKNILTLCAPIGGKTPALGTGPAIGPLVGGGARAPLVVAQV